MPGEIRSLRESLSLSRPQLARFLGVSEVTIVRYEAPDGSAPRGMTATLLAALRDAAARSGTTLTRRAVLAAEVDPLRSVTRIAELARG